jgi:hypothetical protein
VIIRHGDLHQPCKVESIPQLLEPLVGWFIPETQVANTKIGRSISLLISFQLLFLAFLLPLVGLRPLIVLGRASALARPASSSAL